MSDKEFDGTGFVVWYADNKMKYKTFDSQEQMEKEVARIKERVPNRCILTMAVNWEDDSLMVMNDPKPEVAN